MQMWRQVIGFGHGCELTKNGQLATIKGPPGEIKKSLSTEMDCTSRYYASRVKHCSLVINVQGDDGLRQRILIDFTLDRDGQREKSITFTSLRKRNVNLH